MDTIAERRPRGLVGVLYAEDFDAAPKKPEPVAPAPEPVIIEPVYGAADLAAAHDEGRAAGLAEGERGLAASRVQLLNLVARGLEDARQASAEVTEQAAEAIARVMLSALNACLPALCERHGEGELRALARSLLPALLDEPRIAVRVNPLMAQAMAEEVAALDYEIAERIVVIPSEQIPPGDARLSWQDGTATRDASRVRAAVKDALAGLGLLEQEMIDA